MSKQILMSNDARSAIISGIKTLANAVKITLGPKGRNVVLDRKFTTPLITNDGVTIAKEIDIENPFENIGANLIKEVSIKTNDDAGDGTTTACILTESIVTNGHKNVSNGANPIILRKGIEKAVNVSVNHIKSISKPVSSDIEIQQVATISAGSEEIGSLISEAFKKVGKDGVITIEESKTSQTNLKITQGLEFDRGYISPYMIPQNENFATLENPYIFVTDKKLTNINDLLPLLEEVMKTSKPLLIIAEDVDGEVLSTLALNTMRGSFISVAVKAPAYGEKQKHFLEDIALITGATYISKDLNTDLKTISLSHLGEAQTVKVFKDKTIIVGGKSKSDEIELVKENLKETLKTPLDEYDESNIQDRLARLGGGIAVIEVGAPSEVEMREKKLRIEDALSATKAATKEGIVAGGGFALISCEQVLEDLLSTVSGDEKNGVQIVKDSLVSPLKQIAENAGVDSGIVINKVRENIKNQTNIGYNALTNEYVDMFSFGIIDPTKVTRSALENAGSVASSILTTEVVIADTTQIKQ